MTTEMSIYVIDLTVVPTIISCTEAQPNCIELPSTTVAAIASTTSTSRATADPNHRHQSIPTSSQQYHKHHCSYSSKCLRAMQWCYFQNIENYKEFYKDLRWPGNNQHCPALSTLCWIATICLPCTVMGVLITATGAAAVVSVMCSVLCSAVALASLGYCMLITVLCVAVICVLVGELTCSTLDYCIALFWRLALFHRLYDSLVVISVTALKSISVYIACCCTMFIVAASGYCMLTTVVGAAVMTVLMRTLACHILDHCMPMSWRLAPLSHLYYIFISVGTAALTGMGVLMACFSTIYILAAERVCCRSVNAEYRHRQSARFQMHKKTEAVQLQRRTDRHKNRRQRNRGKHWMVEHWNDQTPEPAQVHVSVQHPDVGPFRFETMVPVTQSIEEFMRNTGLTNAIVMRSDSHTVLTPARTFRDYGFMAGSVISLRATFMQRNDGLLGGGSCDFVTQSGRACAEPSVEGVYCRQHAHPLCAIVELGNECEQLGASPSLAVMHARARMLLDQLNDLAEPDEPLALSDIISRLDSFNRLREFYRAQLLQALQLRQGTAQFAHRSVLSRPAVPMRCTD
jgi:hypothetical protein